MEIFLDQRKYSISILLSAFFGQQIDLFLKKIFSVTSWNDMDDKLNKQIHCGASIMYP